MTIGTAVVLAVLTAVVVAIIAGMVKRHRAGGHVTCPDCGGNTASCASCGGCDITADMARRMAEATRKDDDA